MISTMTITNVTDRELALAHQFEALKYVYQRDHETSQAKIEELRTEAGALKAKLTKFDKPLPSSKELFEIYCKDELAGDWHRAQQNYEAGFLAALKWVAGTPA